MVTFAIRPPEMLRKAFLGQSAKELTERMSWRNLRSHLHLSHIPKRYELSIADVRLRDDVAPLILLSVFMKQT